MARWLAIAVTDNGMTAAAMVTDSAGDKLPSLLPETEAAIAARMDGVERLTALIEMPDDDFRPEVFDPLEDAEAAMVFIEL